MSKLILPRELETAPSPSDQYIKNKIISEPGISPVLPEKIFSLIKKLCLSSRIRGWVKFVMYQPHFNLEIVGPGVLSSSADFKYDPEIPRAGSIRIAAAHHLMIGETELEHEFWHATQFFLHHPPAINPRPECGTTLGTSNNFPFLPLTSYSLNRDWQLLSAVAQTLQKLVKQLEPFINGPLPATIHSLPEPSRSLAEAIKLIPYKMSPVERTCPPSVQMALLKHPKSQIVQRDPLDLIKRRYLFIPSTTHWGQMDCAAYTSCEQIDHPICQSLDWATFAVRRMFAYEYLYKLKLTLSFSDNLNKHSAVMWNLLLKWSPQSSLAQSFNKKEVWDAIHSEFKVPHALLQRAAPADRYKLFLKEAQIPVDEFPQLITLLATQVEMALKLITEIDTVLATELGDTIYHIKAYQNISAQHQDGLNLWFGLCSNHGSAVIHLPHPDECFTQPARCGEFPAAQYAESRALSTAFTSCLMSFFIQGLKHKTSPSVFNQITSVFELGAYMALAGPTIGALTFAVIQGTKYVNRRYQWFSESKADIALRALPMAGLFLSPASTIAEATVSIAASLAGSMAGSKLADWSMR